MKARRFRASPFVSGSYLPATRKRPAVDGEQSLFGLRSPALWTTLAGIQTIAGVSTSKSTPKLPEATARTRPPSLPRISSGHSVTPSQPAAPSSPKTQNPSPLRPSVFFGFSFCSPPLAPLSCYFARLHFAAATFQQRASFPSQQNGRNNTKWGPAVSDETKRKPEKKGLVT
jgi:hypothetical protein